MSLNYASQTLTDVQLSHATFEKEMHVMVFEFDKFWSYLIGSKVIVHTNHPALKYLLAKKDANLGWLDLFFFYKSLTEILREEGDRRFCYR